VAIVQHDMQLDRSTYEVLQILSISLTDKTLLRELFNKTKSQKDKERFRLKEPRLFDFWRCFPKYVYLDKSVIEVKESKIESFKMIEEFLRKAASFTKSPANTLPQPAVIPLYTNSMFFSHEVIFSAKCSCKAIPAISSNTPTGYPQIQ
jgi:hypothetical protein